MSAPKEKKPRQDAPAKDVTTREEKRQKEAAEARRSAILYRVVGAVCVVLVAFLLIWNAGLIQRSAAAVTIGSEKYTAADVQYYYASLANQYGLSSNSSSMKDFLLPSAVEALKTDAALVAQARAEGYTMSQEAQDYLDAQLEALDGLADQKTVLRSNYGPYMTRDKLASLMEMQLMASDYSNSYMETLNYTDADLKSYYQENKDSLDTVTLSQFTLQATVDTTGTSMTDDAKASLLEESKTQMKALAEELQRRLESGADPADLAEEYKDSLYSSQISNSLTGAQLNSSYSQWALDSARRSGDVTLAEYDSSSSYYYYVVRFEDRFLDEAPTNNVRHILIAPETDEGSSTPTDQQMADAKAKAEELLKQWAAGPATEASFAELARENSADSGSASNGGLISNITASSSYVENFKNWAIDPARRQGDTGLVESSYGWHIMYYTAGQPAWQQTALYSLQSQAYQAWTEAALEGRDATEGLGMKFVQG